MSKIEIRFLLEQAQKKNSTRHFKNSRRGHAKKKWSCVAAGAVQRTWNTHEETKAKEHTQTRCSSTEVSDDSSTFAFKPRKQTKVSDEYFCGLLSLLTWFEGEGYLFTPHCVCVSFIALVSRIFSGNFFERQAGDASRPICSTATPVPWYWAPTSTPAP